MANQKLYLLDAMALVFRAYYSMIRSPRITSKGKNTNAQFGFTNALYQLIKDHQPTHLAVVWDTHAPTIRHENFEAYKANRQPPPEDIIQAIPDIKEIVQAFNIPCIEKDGYEADDIIGTLALEAGRRGYEVYMVTPDKDYGQLVRDNVFMLRPPHKGQKFETMGPKEICEKWGINRVDQVIDILAMMGDAVDNIPGIKGVGEKTAAKLIQQYDNTENVLAHADEIKGALGKKIQEGKEDAILSKQLATIITDVPVELNEEALKLSQWDRPRLEKVFADLEFRTLGRRILMPEEPKIQQGSLFEAHEAANSASAITQHDRLVAEIKDLKTIQNTPHEYKVVSTQQQYEDFLKEALKQKEIAFDTETTSIEPRKAELVGMSFSWESGKAFYFPCPTDQQIVKEHLQRLSTLFANPDILWVGQNFKYDLIILKNYGIELAGNYFDTMLAHFSLDTKGKHNMDALSEEYLGYQPVKIESLIGKKGKNQGNMMEVAVEEVKEYAAEDADVTFQLKEVFQPLLKKEKVEELFYDVENPLAEVLADMEFEGVGLDSQFLKDYSKELEGEIAKAENLVYETAGVKFNLASPKQLGEILFDRLHLMDNPKKTKTGQYKTGEDVLTLLAPRFPIVEQILTYRELSKLKSTYLDALPKLVNSKTGRLHTSFNQVVVSSGRLSSNNPNLQNIPVRTERGREIRRAFIPRDKDYTLLSADYSQIELRVVAALSGDEHMVEAFKAGKDIHRATAAKVNGVSEDDVSREMRRSAKAVNFGIIYGQSAFGLSQSLNIPRTEAKAIIDSYFREYKAIKTFMDGLIEFAKTHGYVETMKGRRIWLPDITSRNATVRGFSERVAINAPIQGSAADMIKLAMINIHKELKNRNLKTKMILQVHDELVFDVYKSELEEVQALVQDKMEHALVLPHDVPAKVECGLGDNWLDAH